MRNKIRVYNVVFVRELPRSPQSMVVSDKCFSRCHLILYTLIEQSLRFTNIGEKQLQKKSTKGNLKQGKILTEIIRQFSRKISSIQVCQRLMQHCVTLRIWLTQDHFLLVQKEASLEACKSIHTPKSILIHFCTETSKISQLMPNLWGQIC